MRGCFDQSRFHLAPTLSLLLLVRLVEHQGRVLFHLSYVSPCEWREAMRRREGRKEGRAEAGARVKEGYMYVLNLSA